MARQFFLWPRAAPLSTGDLIGPPCPADAVESRLRSLFTDSEPVLFSSARAGLTAVLQNLGLSRPDLLWTPPFSSHCVLEAVAHVCTPVPAAVEGIGAALLYHQWGFVHRSTFSTAVRIVEDAVDSLLLPGTSPFAAGGDFALWSLPKVLSTQAGGVVFCRQAQDAQALRTIRASRSSSALQALLRWSSHSSALAATYWNGAEALQGELLAPLRRQVLQRLNGLQQLAEDRLVVLRDMSPSLALSLERSGRLPSNLPLRVPPEWRRVWDAAGPVSSGLRSFNVARTGPDSRWVRVAPLPVHADVSRDHLRDMLHRLNLKDDFHEFAIV
jgi:putative PLP-dependent aminotransferase (TIGR04422 family)